MQAVEEGRGGQFLNETHVRRHKACPKQAHNAFVLQTTQHLPSDMGTTVNHCPPALPKRQKAHVKQSSLQTAIRSRIKSGNKIRTSGDGTADR